MMCSCFFVLSEIKCLFNQIKEELISDKRISKDQIIFINVPSLTIKSIVFPMKQKLLFAIIKLFMYLDHGRYELALAKSTIRKYTEANGYMDYHTTC